MNAAAKTAPEDSSRSGSRVPDRHREANDPADNRPAEESVDDEDRKPVAEFPVERDDRWKKVQRDQ